MNLVDSSGWLEFFAKDRNAAFYAPPIEDIENLLVPTISIYEVFKRVRQQTGDTAALSAVAVMMQGTVIELDAELAIEAARLSSELKLPMADSIIWATAQLFEATLWTQDSHFEELPGVQFIRKAQDQ